MPSPRDTDLPDLVAGVIDDARALVELQVSSLKTDLADRLGDLSATIQTWAIAVAVALVAIVLVAISLAATLAEVAGMPWYAALWIVTAISIVTVTLLVVRARAKGRETVKPKELTE